MKICFVADGGSEIALSWMSHLVARGHEVHLISSRPCPSDVLPGAERYTVPLSLMGLTSGSGQRVTVSRGLATAQAPPGNRPASPGWRGGKFWGVLSAVRYDVAALEIHRKVRRVRALIGKIAPDLVHAMRIPFEGIIAAKAVPPGVPLLISVWGNDFTLFAGRRFLIGRQTRQAMRRADALHCDCERDARLAYDWGFDRDKPGRVLPGAGGVRADVFFPGDADPALRDRLALPPRGRVVINPRGFRSYVPLEPFLRAIRVVADKDPGVAFLCVGLEGNPVAVHWVERLGIGANVRLLGKFDHDRMAEMFRLAAVAVSPSLHDGTPNTLLESMACGCFPVAGDIESVREWISDGRNGLLCDPTDPESVAAALLRALDDGPLREGATATNLGLIADRAEYGATMRKAEEFYLEVIDHVRGASGALPCAE